MRNNIKTKNVYVVLGMVRSGTSAITKGLSALGIDLGNKLNTDKSCNAKGIYEDIDVVYKINRGVAKALNCFWESISRIDHLCHNNDNLQPLKESAINLIQQRMTQTHHWGFKDPRTSRILPFWQSVFNSLALQDHYVIAVRNPLESIHSWQKVIGLDIEIGLLSWLSLLISAIEGTKGKKRVVVSFELLLQNPHLQLERIKQALNITPLSTQSEIDAYTSEFIDNKLRHQKFTDADLLSHPVIAIAPLCVKLYELLMKLAQDEIMFDSDPFEKKWHEIMTDFETLSPIYSYVDSLLKKNKELERKNRSIQNSLSWKVIYPLRKLENVIKSLRKNKRMK